MFPTIPPAAQRLLIMARLPEYGAVKTRLAAEVGAERALAAYRAMLADTLASVGTPGEAAEFEVLWAPTDIASAQTLSAAFGDFPLAVQTGPDLGTRLATAFSERFFFHRTEKVIAIGVDDPAMPRGLIDAAFALLDSCDWVIGPATDGGYTLIGCRGAAFDVSPFLDIEWGSETVYAATLEKIRKANRNVAVLPLRRDLDTLDDLRWFARTDAGGNLGRLVREWGVED